MEIPSFGEVDGALVWAISASAIVVLVSSSFLASIHKVGDNGKPKNAYEGHISAIPDNTYVNDVDMSSMGEEDAQCLPHEEPRPSECSDAASLKKDDVQVPSLENEADTYKNPVKNDKFDEWLGRTENTRSRAGDSYDDVVLPPPPPYPNGWFYLCHSDAVRQDPKYVKALGLHLAVFRGESGAIHVLDAFCPHLGANLAIGGTVQGDCLKCPFHHWTFNGTDGKLENIPYSDDKKKRISIGSYPVREQDGLVLFWVHAEDSKPTWFPPVVSSNSCSKWFLYNILDHKFLGPLRSVSLQFATLIYSVLGRDNSVRPRNCVTRDQIFCHVQEIPENGADSSHFNAVHRDVKLPFLRNFIRHEWVWKWESLNSDHCKNQDKQHTNSERPWYISRIEFQNCLKLFGYKIFSLQGYANQVGPGLVYLQLNFPLGITVNVIETVTPVAPMSQHVTHSFYSPVLIPWLALWVLSRLLQEQFLRDKSIWDHKLYLNRPYIVRKDGPVLAFRRWYKQFYSPNSEPFESAMRRCEREILATAANLSASIDSQSNRTISDVLHKVIEQKLSVSPSSYDW